MAVTTAESSTEGPPVAAAAVATARPRSDHGWVWQVTALSIALGVMLALAVRTTSHLRASSVTGSRLQVSAAFLSRYKDRNNRLQQEIVELRRQVSEYVAGMESDSRTTAALKKQFEELKLQAGLSAVEGPGLKITVRDSTQIPVLGSMDGDYREYMVHDQDLNNILTELKAAGAQHLALSGADTENLQRVIATTTARCVGPTAIVNGTPLSAPYHIFAIGDPARLREMLERPEGYIRGVRQLDVRKMVEIEDVKQLVLPEYSGTLTTRYARPVAESRKAQSTDGKAPATRLSADR